MAILLYKKLLDGKLQLYQYGFRVYDLVIITNVYSLQIIREQFLNIISIINLIDQHHIVETV